MENEIKRLLKDKWHIDVDNDYWIPLSLNQYPNTQACYCDLDVFNRHVGMTKLNEILNSICLDEMIKIVAFNSVQKVNNLEEIEVGYDYFYTNKYADWVIYITHEGTITFGGYCLINKIKSEFTNLIEYVNENPL